MSEKPKGEENPARQRMLAVSDKARLLRRLVDVEREFFRTVSVLIPRVGRPELKYILAQHVWEATQHARFLSERGGELAGFRRTDKGDPVVRAIFEKAIRHADTSACLGAFYRVLKPALSEAYRFYNEAANSLADWPTRQLITEFLSDEERHDSELKPFLSSSDEVSDWEQQIRRKLEMVGGWFGNDAREQAASDANVALSDEAKPYPATCNRGSFPVCATAFGEDPDSDAVIVSWMLDPKTDPRIIRIMIYVWLMNEMDAVDYLPTIIYDTPDAPLNMHCDMARHLWDESRHSHFGFQQLPRLGIDPATVPQQVELYNALVRMRPDERYALMTMHFEAGSFDGKAVIMDRVRELNDFETDTLLAFDRNDEQNHVRYGHRWMTKLMERYGEKRAPEEFVKASRDMFLSLVDEERHKLSHTLPPEKRLTANRIAKIALADD